MNRLFVRHNGVRVDYGQIQHIGYDGITVELHPRITHKVTRDWLSARECYVGDGRKPPQRLYIGGSI